MIWEDTRLGLGKRPQGDVFEVQRSAKMPRVGALAEVTNLHHSNNNSQSQSSSGSGWGRQSQKQRKNEFMKQLHMSQMTPSKAVAAAGGDSHIWLGSCSNQYQNHQ
jgi:hypothetical protein